MAVEDSEERGPWMNVQAGGLLRARIGASSSSIRAWSNVLAMVDERKASVEPGRSITAMGASGEGEDMLEIMPLGAGSEVGRSCVLAKYKNKSVMFDCGVHPGYSGIASLPYFDEVDLSTIDAMLVTHFHLDHCAAVPFVVGHTNFRGRIFMTHPTKAIFAMLMSDFVKLNKGADSEALFTDKDVQATMQRIEVICIDVLMCIVSR